MTIKAQRFSFDRNQQEEEAELRSGKTHYSVFPHQIKEIDKAKMQLDAAVSVETADRAGDTIDISGYELGNFEKNPRVMWVHDYSELPVATALSIKKAPPILVSRMEFWNGDGEWGDWTRELFAMYAHEPPFMSSFSVGFIPLEWEARFETDGEGRKRFVGFHFSRQDLLEYSAVPIPMHPDALALALQDGLFPKFRGMVSPEFAGSTARQVQAQSLDQQAVIKDALRDMRACTQMRDIKRNLRRRTLNASRSPQRNHEHRRTRGPGP